MSFPGRQGVPTIADVAEEAGVSVSTVSRYLRGFSVRRPEEVSAAIERLDFRPNAAARGLRLKSMEAIAVVVHDITNPFASALVQGVQSIADTQRFSLYLVAGGDDIEASLFDIGARVDGIICATATEGSGVVEALARLAKPVVLVEFEPSDHQHGFDVVVIDNEKGAEKAVSCLVELGHRQIGVIAGPDWISVGRERLAGAHAAAAASPDVNLIVESSDFTDEGGYRATARLVGRPARARPTAIFAPNNLTALGSLRCLRDLEIEVPKEISFIGFDPLPTSDLMNPSPTTVDRPETEVGAIAMQLLEKRMKGKAEPDASRVILGSKLEMRGSCASPTRLSRPAGRIS